MQRAAGDQRRRHHQAGGWPARPAVPGVLCLACHQGGCPGAAAAPPHRRRWVGAPRLGQWGGPWLGHAKPARSPAPRHASLLVLLLQMRSRQRGSCCSRPLRGPLRRAACRRTTAGGSTWEGKSTCLPGGCQCRCMPRPASHRPWRESGNLAHGGTCLLCSLVSCFKELPTCAAPPPPPPLQLAGAAGDGTSIAGAPGSGLRRAQLAPCWRPGCPRAAPQSCDPSAVQHRCPITNSRLLAAPQTCPSRWWWRCCGSWTRTHWPWPPAAAASCGPCAPIPCPACACSCTPTRCDLPSMQGRDRRFCSACMNMGAAQSERGDGWRGSGGGGGEQHSASCHDRACVSVACRGVRCGGWCSGKLQPAEMAGTLSSVQWPPGRGCRST